MTAKRLACNAITKENRPCRCTAVERTEDGHLVCKYHSPNNPEFKKWAFYRQWSKMNRDERQEHREKKRAGPTVKKMRTAVPKCDDYELRKAAIMPKVIAPAPPLFPLQTRQTNRTLDLVPRVIRRRPKSPLPPSRSTP